MRRWLMVVATLSQGCGLLMLPLPGEPWVLADEATGVSRPDIALLEGDGLVQGRTQAVEPQAPTAEGNGSTGQTEEPVEPVRPAPEGPLWSGSFVKEIAAVGGAVYGTDGRSLWRGVRGEGIRKVADFPDAQAEWPAAYVWTVGGGYVWAASTSDTRILRVSIEGGTFESLWSTEGYPEAMTFMGGQLYWTEVTTSKASLWRKGSGAAQPITEGDDTPMQFAVSGSKVWGLNRVQTSICEYGTGQPICEAVPNGNRGLAVTADPHGYYVAVNAPEGIWVWGRGRSLGLVKGDAPRYLAVGNGKVYWGNVDGLWGADLEGKGVARAYPSQAEGPLTTTEDALYWIATTGNGYRVEARAF